LRQTGRGGTVDGRSVVEARSAGEGRCYAGAASGNLPRQCRRFHLTMEVPNGGTIESETASPIQLGFQAESGEADEDSRDVGARQLNRRPRQTL